VNKTPLTATARRCAIAAAGTTLAIGALAGTAGPAGAAPAGPNSSASCVGQIFVPQALEDPAAFVAKIAEVKEIAGSFGVAIGGAQGGPGLAHWPNCAPE
jgi:hypothetical protein